MYSSMCIMYNDVHRDVYIYVWVSVQVFRCTSGMYGDIYASKCTSWCMELWSSAYYDDAWDTLNDTLLHLILMMHFYMMNTWLWQW